MRDVIEMSQVQTMSSLLIAELTGKRHQHIMEAIRKMEPAWGKVNGSKFRLVEYKDAKGEMRPCYELIRQSVFISPPNLTTRRGQSL